MRRIYLQQVLQAVKRFIFGTGHITLCGNKYHVVYQSRRAKEDRDYKILQRLAEGKTCIFDIGANKGHASLVMVPSLADGGKIFAFEASEAACNIIIRNAALNDLSSQIKVFNAVLNSNTGAIIDFHWEESSGGASIIPGYLSHNEPIKKVSLAIDDFVLQMDLRPDLIKIDVEGAESAVIQGMKHVLKSMKPLVMVEVHSWEGVSIIDNVKQIIPTLNEVNYQMIYLQNKSYVEDLNVFQNRGRCHVLLIPVEVAIPEWLNDFNTASL